MRLHLLIAMMLVSLPATAGTAKRIFRHTTCGIEFAFPKTWIVRSGADPCSFHVSPKNLKSMIERDDMDLFTIYVTVRNVGFAAGVEDAGFVQKPDGWKVLGRQGMTSPAERIMRNGWSGLRGNSQTGCYYESGGYAGLCSVPAAFVGTETVSAELVGATQSEKVFDELIASFRFLSKQK